MYLCGTIVGTKLPLSAKSGQCGVPHLNWKEMRALIFVTGVFLAFITGVILTPDIDAFETQYFAQEVWMFGVGVLYFAVWYYSRGIRVKGALTLLFFISALSYRLIYLPSMQPIVQDIFGWQVTSWLVQGFNCDAGCGEARGEFEVLAVVALTLFAIAFGAAVGARRLIQRYYFPRKSESAAN